MMKENLVSMLRDGIRQHWLLPALSDYQGKNYRYADVGREIMRLHAVFAKAHVKKGDKIALMGKNCANWGIVYLSAITYGAVIVPILSDFHTEDAHHIVTHSDAVFFFVSPEIYDKLDPARMPALIGVFSLADLSLIESTKKIVQAAVEEASLICPASALDFEIPDVENDHLAALVYTSGTTGFSKGVMTTHNNITANIIFAQQNMPLRAGDRIVSFLPLAHAYGCAFEFIFPFSLGCHVTFLTKTPSPKIIVQAFQEIKPNLVLAVPLILEKIYRKQVVPILNSSKVKLMMRTPFLKQIVERKVLMALRSAFGGKFFEVVIGGAPLNPEVEAFLQQIHFPFSVGYGMTECAPLVCYMGWKRHRFRSVGKTVDTLQLRIDSPDPANVVGEVLLKGEAVMLGYYKNEVATKDVFDADGWMHTGDLGLMDAENFVYLKGRSKNMILGPSGQNIYPEEIENKLNNMPFVQESLVIRQDEKLVALVYPDWQEANEKGMTEEKLALKMDANRKLLNDRLPAFSQVVRIKLWPNEFEKTPTKKIKRFLYEAH
jgi:long-chain acyl-CoA synthetase